MATAATPPSDDSGHRELTSFSRGSRVWTEVGLVVAATALPALYTSVRSLIAEGRTEDPDAVQTVEWYLAETNADQLFYTLPWVVLAILVIGRSGEPVRRFGIRTPVGVLDALLGVALALGFTWILEPAFEAVAGDFADASSSWMGDLIPPDWQVWQVETDFLAVILIAAGNLFNAVAEELVIRAYLLTRLRELLRSTIAAVVGSSVVFASYHIYQGAYGGVWALLFGLVFGAAFVITGRIWPLILAHWLIGTNRESVYGGVLVLGVILIGIPLVRLAVRLRR